MGLYCGTPAASDDPVGPQLLDNGRLVAEFLKDLVGMLAELGRAAADGEWWTRQFHRLLENRHWLGRPWIVHGMKEPRPPYVFIIQRLLRRVNGPGRDTIGFERLQRL